MSKIGGLFDFSDRVQMESLSQRLIRHEVLTSNIANAETPGFRAIDYSFEKQLQGIADANHSPMTMKTTNSKHLVNAYVRQDGGVYPDVSVRPSESVDNDGNTVDIDQEMAQQAQNQILYKTAVELLNRKIGLIRYAITSGGR